MDTDKLIDALAVLEEALEGDAEALEALERIAIALFANDTD